MPRPNFNFSRTEMPFFPLDLSAERNDGSVQGGNLFTADSAGMSSPLYDLPSFAVNVSLYARAPISAVIDAHACRGSRRSRVLNEAIAEERDDRAEEPPMLSSDADYTRVYAALRRARPGTVLSEAGDRIEATACVAATPGSLPIHAGSLMNGFVDINVVAAACRCPRLTAISLITRETERAAGLESRAINRNDTRAHARELDLPAFFALADLSIYAALSAAPVIAVTVTGEEPEVEGGRGGGGNLSLARRSISRRKLRVRGIFIPDRSGQISRLPDARR